ncbi:MAG: hypothetical protein AAGE52_04340 [Myxococcota bacterium]
MRWMIAVSLMVAACGGESDGRNVVMVPPEEGSPESAGGEGGLSDRPSSVTIGSPARRTVAESWQQEAADLHLEVAQRDDELSTALRGDRCPAAEDIRDRICDLAGRICDIAEQHPYDDDTVQRCNDAEGRCSRASERVSARCEY